MSATRSRLGDGSSGSAANKGGVAAVDRAFTIVEAIEAAKEPLTLAAVAQSTGFYKSSILRLMVTLQARGMIVRRKDHSYMLGPLAFRLGRAFERGFRIEEHLAPLMQDLVERGMESPSFHIRQDADTRLCILRFDSHHSTLDRVRVGDQLPLRRGAAGKVLQHAGRADTDGDAAARVEVSFGERDPLCGAVAAPVFGPGGELLGAVSLSGPLERFTEVSVAKMAKPLLQVCETATRSLGGEWPAHQKNGVTYPLGATGSK